MVIFLAGLTSLPKELTEAAEIDGATYWQSLRYVVIPLLLPATVVVMALAIINSLKSFDIVYVMTQGGPFHSSDTLAMFMYTESFKKYYMGYGSAISVVYCSPSVLAQCGISRLNDFHRGQRVLRSD